jgi:hypothetical protein
MFYQKIQQIIEHLKDTEKDQEESKSKLDIKYAEGVLD